MSDVMRFNVEQNGLYSSLPQVLNFFSSMAFGLLSDVCINKKYLSVKNTRKIFTTTGEKISRRIVVGDLILKSYNWNFQQ